LIDLSVPCWGVPIETFPAATEPPVGSCCADDGNAAGTPTPSAAAITRIGCVHLWLKFMHI
jgi:hypothetical protein